MRFRVGHENKRCFDIAKGKEVSFRGIDITVRARIFLGVAGNSVRGKRKLATLATYRDLSKPDTIIGEIEQFQALFSINDYASIEKE